MMLGEEVRRLISWESFQQPKYVFQNSNGAISILLFALANRQPIHIANTINFIKLI